MAYDDPDAPTLLTPAGLTVFAGRFVNGATSPDDELIVRVPWLDEARTGVPVTWSPLPGPVYPQAGDRVWVMESVSEDGDANEWVAVSWLPSASLAVGGGTPSGPAGGVLAGSYPNPGFAADMATQAELDAESSARTAHAALTTSAHGGIVASTDSRLSDARTPTGAAGGDLAGSYPNPTLAKSTSTLVSNTGPALSNVQTATQTTYTPWPTVSGVAPPSLTIPTAGDWIIESGSILVQQGTANLTEARFCIARNGTPIGGSSVAHLAAVAFAGASMISRAPKTTCAAGDVLTLCYATNAQPASYGGTGMVAIYARRA